LPTWAHQIFARRTVLAAERRTFAKGFDVLLLAFAQPVRGDEDLHLLILGEGEERSRLERMAKELGVSDRVFMPGFQVNPYPFFKRAEVFVLSSRWEGLGMVLLEAALLGLPIVATDCPSGPRELLEEVQCAALIPPDDALALAEATRALLDSDERRAGPNATTIDHAADYDVGRVRSSFENLLLNCFGSVR
jgi:glycosyltransferase involved in cell wall biosynthesis